MKITVETPAERLDKYVAGAVPSYSRGYFQKLIKSGKVTVNGGVSTVHYSPKCGDEINIDLEETISTVAPQDIDLEIIYEDADIVVVNKAPGMVVHPACGHWDGTLLNALYGRAKGSYTPFLVHRLDKDTSGIIVAAKNERAKKSLVKQFQNRTIKKVYITVVKGCVSEVKGRIEAPLGRSPNDRQKIVVGPLAKKDGITEFKVIVRTKEYSVLEVYPLTGRTHQIRSHMVYIGHPVLGDKVYGGLDQVGDHTFTRQMLHARRISLTHPDTGKRVVFEAPVPKDMQAILKDSSIS